MKEIIEKLGNYAYGQGKDFSKCFEEMLDFFADTFDVGRVMEHGCDYASLFSERMEENPTLTELMADWFRYTERGMLRDGAFDFFGTMYEEVVKGKFKSSAMGQFFTPMELCKVISHIVHDDGARTVCDCACGSGRLLLAHHAEADKGKFFYYHADDLDPMCVKMCALNMMANGMMGQVVHHDTLADDFIGAYEVNELRWPIPSPLYSLRKLTEGEYRARRRELAHRGVKIPKKPPEPEFPQQLSLFNF